jgi:S-adenosylmethionine hydrolase
MISSKGRKNVVVITDCIDVAFNEMKWIMLNECKKFGMDDVSVELVSVSEFSLINAAFLTRLMGEQCPKDTVFSVVINPQKNRSARIYGRTANGILFFGANTGALTWFLEHFGIKELYEVHDPGFISFGGKYVHAPNVAKLVAGIPLEEFGREFPQDQLTKLHIPSGTIVHIDNFGLMKIMGDIPKFEEGQKFAIYVNEKYAVNAVFSKRMMGLDDKDWVLYVGSSLHGMPELGAVRHKNGYKEMGFSIGDIVTWKEI